MKHLRISHIFLHTGIAMIAILMPLTQAHAFQMRTCWLGIACINPAVLITRVNDVFFLSSGAIAISIFLVGAFMMVISAGNDTILQAGKRAMKGSLIGLAIITGSYGIYRTVVWWLY